MCERENGGKLERNSMEVVIAIENCMQKKLCQNEMCPAKRYDDNMSKKRRYATQLTHAFKP